MKNFELQKIILHYDNIRSKMATDQLLLDEETEPTKKKKKKSKKPKNPKPQEAPEETKESFDNPEILEKEVSNEELTALKIYNDGIKAKINE